MIVDTTLFFHFNFRCKALLLAKLGRESPLWFSSNLKDPLGVTEPFASLASWEGLGLPLGQMISVVINRM